VGVTLLRKGTKADVRNIAEETPFDLVTGEQRNLLETKHPELVMTGDSYVVASVVG
jgi:hypothetical protein